MRIFPKLLRHEFAGEITPQLLFAALLVAVKGQEAHEVDGMHLSSMLSGPSSDSYMVKARELKDLIDDAVQALNSFGLDALLAKADSIMTNRQKLATIVSLVDLCGVENSVFDGDRSLFEKIRDSFGVSEDQLRPFEDMLTLKNDSSIRLNVIPQSHQRAAEGFRALV